MLLLCMRLPRLCLPRPCPTLTADAACHNFEHTTPHLQAGHLCLCGSHSGLSPLQPLMGCYYLLLDSLQAGVGLCAITLRCMPVCPLLGSLLLAVLKC